MKIIHLNNPSKIDLFNKHADNENNIMVMLFYMDGCHHCDVLKPKWNKLVNEFKKRKQHQHEDVAIANINSKLMSQLNIPPVYQFPTIKLKTADDLKEYKGPHEEKNIKEWIDRVISLSSPKFKTIPRIPQIKSPESPVRSLSSSFMQDLEPIIGKTIRISSKPMTHKIHKHRRRRHRPPTTKPRHRHHTRGRKTPRRKRPRRSVPTRRSSRRRSSRRSNRRRRRRTY
jgi:thiol-disulfide isomerase/thioredoxin